MAFDSGGFGCFAVIILIGVLLIGGYFVADAVLDAGSDYSQSRAAALDAQATVLHAQDALEQGRHDRAMDRLLMAMALRRQDNPAVTVALTLIAVALACFAAWVVIQRLERMEWL